MEKNSISSRLNSSVLQGESFESRHIGPSPKEVGLMLQELGHSSLESLATATVPQKIRSTRPLDLPAPRTEAELLTEVRALASQNQVFRSYIGTGYSNCITPPVILRNILENPGWYTQYTPYQAEIAQGRLEALLNFQTVIIDMTGLPVANASLLDEGTAAAEAMAMCFAVGGKAKEKAFFISEECHPQTIAVLKTRAKPLGIECVVGDHRKVDFSKKSLFGVLVQYPSTYGRVYDYRAFFEQAHAAGALTVMAADLLSLAVLTPPGELGADIAVGSAQRWGVPMGYGGPHAAFFATKDEYKRQVPGRIVGLSQDVDGKPAIRLALQTREQHIRRDKATSNICTAQVLLAILSSMYAVYHGSEGIRRISERVRLLTALLERGLKKLGHDLALGLYFDTLQVKLGNPQQLTDVLAAALEKKMNLRRMSADSVGVSLDETTSAQDVMDLLAVFARGIGRRVDFTLQDLLAAGGETAPSLGSLERKSAYLSHPVFNRHHSETEMLRYIHKLQGRDLSLAFSMIPLGSCTMKLNATTEMLPVTMPEFSQLHPFAPLEQTQGYQKLLKQLEGMLVEVTGFSAVSLQPNAGSQGEYAGLLVIQRFHESRGQGHRTVCLIPRSAHGTNPASAAMAGMQVIVVDCDSRGNVDLADLRAKAKEHADCLSALMVTYPSTHGVFEESITEICETVHAHGGQVYMDGANMNAQIGLCRPGEFGPDVCHLNLHKTFCIPHGGGGPGMGPIAVREHLAPFLPTHPLVNAVGGKEGVGPISAAPWGSASILPISWAYIAMMGAEGLKRATQVAILNANYIAKRLNVHFPLLYKGAEGMVAHECILDCRQFKESAGIEVEDIAKRLMDYGFHAPTISFPVAGTIMIEPTESEPKEEIDRFCEAMIAIRAEIAEIEAGKSARDNNVLKNAPHTAEQIARTEWTRPYSREKAAFPAAWTRESKFWPSVGRINNVLGDRNLICACPPMEAYGGHG